MCPYRVDGEEILISCSPNINSAKVSKTSLVVRKLFETSSFYLRILTVYWEHQQERYTSNANSVAGIVLWKEPQVDLGMKFLVAFLAR